jgi:hypothetical protein
MRLLKQESRSRANGIGAAARAKAARKRRRERADACAAARLAPADAERASVERRRNVIASLLRIAEERTWAIEARGGEPLPSSELKALVDVLERLERLEKSLPPPAHHDLDSQCGPATFEETNLLLEEIAQRYEEFCRKEGQTEDRPK